MEGMHRFCPYHVPRDFPVRHGAEIKRREENKHIVIEQRQLRRYGALSWDIYVEF